MLNEPDFTFLDPDSGSGETLGDVSSPIVFRPRIVLEPPVLEPVLEPPILTLGPSIFSLSPASGARGTQVTINGRGFLGTQAVRFGGFDSRSFTVAADTQIIAQVPPDAVTGPVTVFGPNGSATGGLFTVLESSPLPIVDFFSPLSGTFGTRITITGRNLQPATQVLFNATPAAFVINTPAQIVVDVPAGSTSGRITVTTPAGTAQSQGIFVVIQPSQLPVISSFSPASGPAGTAVDIFGNNFLGTQEVRFNGVPSNQLTVFSNGQIRAQAPANAGTGPITVITGNGSATSAAVFSVPAASPLPTISFFDPISGQAGAPVTITGTNFVNVQSVRFNGVAAGFFVNSVNSITATVPAGATSGLITVTTAAGTAASTQGFVVIAPSQLPSIASFNPAGGPAGTTVTIDGNNFLGASQVRFNGVIAPSFTVQSNTRITAQAPANAGTGPITVATPAGTATSAGFFSVSAPVLQPAISGFSPASGAPGTLVSLNGSNLAGATAVRFNGVNASFTAISSSLVQAVVPSGAASGRISVSTPAGTAQSGAFFTVVQLPALPTITALSPASGQAGTMVIVTGTQLGNATAIRFNGKDAASFTVQSATQVSAMVPLGATTGPVSVVTPAGTAVSPAAFTVLPGAMPGTRKLKRRAQQDADVIPVSLRAGAATFVDDFVAERFISGIAVPDAVLVTFEGRLPKGNVSVEPAEVRAFFDTITAKLEARVATPPGRYSVVVHGRSKIDGAEYDPRIYQISVAHAVVLNVDPSRASVRAGKAADYNVQLDRSPGAMGLPVTLAVADLPADSRERFGEKTTAAASTTLRIRTAETTPVGEAELRVLGSAVFEGAPVDVRSDKAKLEVKEPRVQLLIDQDKQSQSVEAGKVADFPFRIQRSGFTRALTVELERPDFVDKVEPPSGARVADTFNLRFFTSPGLTVDRTENIEVRLLDADRTVMATATIQLTAVGSLTVTLRIEEGETAVAGREAEINVVLEKSRPSPELDLVVLNDAQLRGEGITAVFDPARTPGTMSKLKVATLTSTRVDDYDIFVEVRRDGVRLDGGQTKLSVMGRVFLETEPDEVQGLAGQALQTELRVVERTGVPDTLLVDALIDGPIQVSPPSPFSLFDTTQVFVTLGEDAEPGVRYSVHFRARVDEEKIFNNGARVAVIRS